MAGLETYSQEDLDRMVQMLTTAEGEKQLMSWVTDWVGRSLAVTQGSQIIGVPQLAFVEAPMVASPGSTTSGTFVDLTNIGPTLSGITDGNYIFFWGCTIQATGAGDVVGQMSILPSWAGGSDSHVAPCAIPLNTMNNAVYSRAFGTQGPAVVDSSGQGNNSARARYRRQSGAGTAVFTNAWMCAVRVGPPTPGN